MTSPLTKEVVRFAIREQPIALLCNGAGRCTTKKTAAINPLRSTTGARRRVLLGWRASLVVAQFALHRLSLRERPAFRGAKGDKLRHSRIFASCPVVAYASTSPSVS